MNRFEQKSMSLGRKLIYLLPILAFVILFVLFLRGIGSVGESTLSKQQESLETALERSISQCYAVEGCYPPSLEYLEQHYGLLYDEDSFFIDYEYYGSNLLPEVTVLRRTGIVLNRGGTGKRLSFTTRTFSTKCSTLVCAPPEQ